MGASASFCNPAKLELSEFVLIATSDAVPLDFAKVLGDVPLYFATSDTVPLDSAKALDDVLLDFATSDVVPLDFVGASESSHPIRKPEGRHQIPQKRPGPAPAAADMPADLQRVLFVSSFSHTVSWWFAGGAAASPEQVANWYVQGMGVG